MSRRPLREKQRLFWRLISEGRSRLAAARELGLSHHTGQRWFRQGGGVASSHVHARASGRYLSFAEREGIFAGVERGHSIRLIAKNLDRAPSTVLRELRRNMRQQYRTRSRLESRPGRHRTAPWDYRPSAAQRGADLRAARPKSALLVTNRRLHDWVQAKLEKRMSPEQISARLPFWFPKDVERGCRTRRSTSRFTFRAEVRFVASSPFASAPGERFVSQDVGNAGDESPAWSTSVSDQLRSRTGRCPVIGKATSSWARTVGLRLARWSSGPLVT